MKIPWQGPRDGRLWDWYTDVPQHIRHLPGIKEMGGRFRVPRNARALYGHGRPALANKPDGYWDLLLDQAGWDAPFTMLPHQYRFFNRMEGNHFLQLWSPTGSGKKYMGAAWWAMKRHHSAVFVSRASDVPGWLRAMRKFAGVDAIPLRGLDPAKSPEAREALPAVRRGNAVFVTGWETLHPGSRGEFFDGWAGWLIKNLGSPAVYLDESHYAKNPKRWIRTVLEDGDVNYTPRENRSAATMLLARPAYFRLLMTATPVANRLHDLWAILDLGEPGCYGTSTDFGMGYCGAEHNGYGWDFTGRSNAGELRRRLIWSSIAIKRAEYAKHLPEVRYETVPIPRGDQDTPGAMPREVRAAMRGYDEVVLAEALVMEAAIRKTSVTIQQVRRSADSGHKIVVFTGRRREVKRIATSVQARRPNLKVWTASGDDTPDARDKIREEYMAHPGPCCLVATGHSMGESVDIQDTDHAILSMLPWTPEHLIQWIGRFSRLGGTRKCLVSFLIAEGTYDDEMRATLLDKLEDVQASIEDADAETYAGALAEKLNQEKAMTRLTAWLQGMKK